MIHEFVRTLRTQIEAEIRSSTEQIARGSADTFADYKYLAGRIQGLRATEELLSDLAKKVENDDD